MNYSEKQQVLKGILKNRSAAGNNNNGTGNGNVGPLQRQVINYYRPENISQDNNHWQSDDTGFVDYSTRMTHYDQQNSSNLVPPPLAVPQSQMHIPSV